MTSNLSGILRRLNHLTGELNGLYHEATRRLGLTDSAMDVLYITLSEGEPCPLADIVRLSGCSKQTINSALRSLEADGMLYLESAGARAKTVRLTEAGRALAERTALRLMEVEDRLFADWPKEDVEAYAALTQRHLDDLNARIDQL